MVRAAQRRITVLLLITGLLFAPVRTFAMQDTAAIYTPDPENTIESFFTSAITREEAAEDLTYLYQQVMRNHCFVRTNKPDFKALCQNKLDGLAPVYTPLAYYRYIADVIPALDCGHSALYPSDEILETLSENDAYFPLGVFIRNGSIYVTGNQYHPEIPRGAEILQINGKSAKDILDTLSRYISSDGSNTTHQNYMASAYFYSYYTHFIAAYRTYHIVFADPVTKEIRAYTAEGRKRSQVEYALPDMQSDLYCTVNDTYAKMDLNSFSTIKYTYPDFCAIIDSFFQKIHEQGTNRLIIDVRGNLGGDPYISAYLLRYLLPVEEPYFASGTWGYASLEKTQTLLTPHYQGKLYILMDGGSFSTTGHFLSKLRDHDAAVFIGEQSGATYLSTDASIYRDLPVSGSRLKLSTAAYRTYVHSEFDLSGILPDIEITPAIDDVISYHDTVCTYVVESLLKAE